MGGSSHKGFLKQQEKHLHVGSGTRCLCVSRRSPGIPNSRALGGSAAPPGSRAGLPSRAAGKAQTARDGWERRRWMGAEEEEGREGNRRLRGGCRRQGSPSGFRFNGRGGDPPAKIFATSVNGGWRELPGLEARQAWVHPNQEPRKKRPGRHTAMWEQGGGGKVPATPRGSPGAAGDGDPTAPPAPASAQGGEGREEEKETDGQRWKHKLTRRKRINSRQGADPSTYAVPQPARHGEVPRRAQCPSPRRGPSHAGRWAAGRRRRLEAWGESPVGV